MQRTEMPVSVAVTEPFLRNSCDFAMDTLNATELRLVKQFSAGKVTIRATVMALEIKDSRCSNLLAINMVVQRGGQTRRDHITTN